MSNKLVLIYDARCSLCCGCMRWIKLHAKSKDEFDFIECQSEKRRERFPDIKEKACLEAFHLILPDKQVLIGDRAVPDIVSKLKNLQWLAILFKTPVIRFILYVVYRFIANNRFIIAQTILPLSHNHN